MSWYPQIKFTFTYDNLYVGFLREAIIHNTDFACYTVIFTALNEIKIF